MQTAIDWLTQWGTSQKDSGRAIVVDEDKRYAYVTGYTEGSLSDDSTDSDGTKNIWIAKFYARSGEQIWLQQLTPDNDTTQTSNSIALDESGVYVAIETTHNDETLSSNDETLSIAIAKFALEDGTQQETYSFQSENDVSNSIYALVADGSGYLYATGYVAGSMLSETGAVLDSAGGDDAWIAKLTVEGDLVWVVQLGSDADDRANGIAIDDRGNVYVVGYTTGVMPGIETGTSDKTENADNLEDAWIAKYTSDGSRDWIVQFGSNDNDRATGVTVDESGGVYAIGKTEDSLTDDPREDGSGERAWVAKFRASSGERVWLEQLSHTNSSDNKNTEGTSIAVDNYGGVYIAGWTTGQLTTDATNTNNDAWIAKYSAPTGAQIWLEHVASSSDRGDGIHGITVDPEGNLYATGFTYGEMSDLANNEEDADIWIARFREVATNYNVLSFDGVDDDLVIANTDRVFDLVNAWTLEAWVKPAEAATDGQADPIISKIAEDGNNEDTFRLVWIDNRFSVSLEREEDGQDFSVISDPHTEGEFYHVAAVYDGDELRIYVNAVSEDSQTIGNVTAYTGTADLHIGNDLNSSHGSKGVFNGLMDDIRIWNVARTADEISENYKKTLTGSENGLVAYWNFNNDSSSSNTIVDVTGNGNNGTLVNGQGDRIIASPREGKDDAARVLRQSIASLLSTGEDSDRANPADSTTENSDSIEEESNNETEVTPEDSDLTEEEESSNEENNFDSVFSILSG